MLNAGANLDILVSFGFYKRLWCLVAHTMMPITQRTLTCMHNQQLEGHDLIDWTNSWRDMASYQTRHKVTDAQAPVSNACASDCRHSVEVMRFPSSHNSTARFMLCYHVLLYRR